MNLLEFEAKTLLRDAGLPVPESVCLGPDDAVQVERPVFVKAQVPFGGRGKQGLVLPADTASAAQVVDTLRNRMRALGFASPRVLLEPAAEVSRECYLAWQMDDLTQGPVLLFSARGGVDIESAGIMPERLQFAAHRRPLAHDFVDFFSRAGFSGRTLAALCRFAVGSWRVFVQNDAQLLEINPLAIDARGAVIALDAKIALDDNAASRHGEWARLYSADLEATGTSALEQRARAEGFTFIELGGRTAVLSGGAGLGMALVDVLADAGRPAANFVDASGGSGAAIFNSLGALVLERAARDDVDAILMYFTLSATSLAAVVRGLLGLFDRIPPPKPMVVGLLTSGAAERDMTFDQARELIEARGWRCARDLQGVLDALLALPAGTTPHPPLHRSPDERNP